MKINCQAIRHARQKCLAEFRNENRLTQSDVLVFECLALTGNWHTIGNTANKFVSANITLEEIADNSFCSLRSAKYAVKKLEQMGWIEVYKANQQFGKQTKSYIIVGVPGKITDQESDSQSQFNFQKSSENETWEKVIKTAEKVIRQYPRKGKSGTVKQVADELDRICNPEKNPNYLTVGKLMEIAVRYCQKKGEYALGLHEFLKQDVWKQWISKQN